ncbi:hypothetical protein ACFUJY_22635 [Streptomyces sp. NPDC057249]|uniref:hypothetical protein n=1 Tax=Streptomyces sp. NPDC057249 TaxID=3346067 RepID=UPI0036357AC2
MLTQTTIRVPQPAELEADRPAVVTERPFQPLRVVELAQQNQQFLLALRHPHILPPVERERRDGALVIMQ